MTVLVVLASAKGAPGVTTAALALAATWPSGQSPVLLECDSSGGDLITGYQLDAEPGLTSLAAAARRDRRQRLVSAHAQRLPGGLPVVAAPSAAEQAAAAAGVLLSSVDWAALAAEGSNETLLVDAGRLPAGPLGESPLARLLRAADALLLVAENDTVGVVHAAARVEPLSRLVRSSQRLWLLLVEAGGFAPGDIAAALGVEVAGLLPFDRRAAAALTGREPPPRHGRWLAVRRARPLHRSPLLKTAAAVGHRLATSRAHAETQGTREPAARGFVPARPEDAGPRQAADVPAWSESGDGR